MPSLATVDSGNTAFASLTNSSAEMEYLADTWLNTSRLACAASAICAASRAVECPVSRARPRVTRDHDGTARPLGTDKAFGCQLAAVRQLDRLPLAELAPQRTLRNARSARFLHVE